MKSLALVRDLMVPLCDYPVVNRDATLLEAVQALEKSRQQLSAGKQPHRAVLVRNEQGAIVGKLGYFAMLRALRPRQADLFGGRMVERAGISDDIMQQAMDNLSRFSPALESICERAKFVHLRDVMLPTTVQVQEDVRLAETLSTFAEHQTLSLLVYRGKQPVGVLRLSDVIDEMTARILNCRNGEQT